MAIPKRDENKIEELVERCEVIHRHMRAVLREEWEHTFVLSQSVRGTKRGKEYKKIVKRANELAKAEDALRVAHCRAAENMRYTDVPMRKLPSPYRELENATDDVVREWILNWITEARERLAEGM